MGKKIIAVVPARSGSKGLPNKNLMKLKGKSLVQRAVEAGLGSRHIEKVLISTDDPQIAEEAVEKGAWCPFLRPKELAADDSPAVETYIHIINKLKEGFDISFDALCILQPTSPLRQVRDVDAAIKLFFEKNADSVVSYCKAAHPLQWHRYVDANLVLREVFNDPRVKNRQEYSDTYLPNGAVFVFRPGIILKRLYYTENSYAYLMPKERSIDIDDWSDFKCAEALVEK
ncbi:MAG: acylneuraminate cytidylyltransferase family protein [Desulfobacteraceae bacterium]|nr:acylneuraminate cytidylyltransferase family protein [Desulfobacteraceae bacterium]